MRRSRSWLAMSLFVALVGSVTRVGAQPPDHHTLAEIRDEGLRRSQVMDHIGWLSDVYGPRVTGTPAIEAAGAWARQVLEDWGLEVRTERFGFGHGWSLVRFHAHMVEPQVMPIIGFPRSWSSSTDGTVTAEAVRIDIRTGEDLERLRGTLAGKIVLPQTAREVPMLEGNVVLRMSEAQLADASRTQVPPPAPPRRASASAARTFAAQVQQFYRDEGVVAILDRGSDDVTVGAGSNLPIRTQRTDGGTIFVGSGGPRDDRAGSQVPAVTIAVEHYNRMVRLLDKGISVSVELHVETEFHPEASAPESQNAFNLLAELPGTDLADEVVLIGAHFDTTHAGTGATDNAAGVAAMMEVMRILKAIGAAPRRTIRLALWGGEEQGLLGSREYVRRHYANRDALRPDHARLSAYYNIDNGAGRLRGIWLQGNSAAAAVFEDWIVSMRDLGVTTMGPRSVSGTDHVPFDAVGLPGFQFIQDRLEYNSRTHHSNMDVVDRVQREDAVQMAVVAAIFAYNTAMRDDLIPRKPVPVSSR